MEGVKDAPSNSIGSLGLFQHLGLPARRRRTLAITSLRLCMGSRFRGEEFHTVRAAEDDSVRPFEACTFVSTPAVGQKTLLTQKGPWLMGWLCLGLCPKVVI